MDSAKPAFDQILTSLTNEVLFGKAYLKIATELAGTDPVVLHTSPAFFGLTLEASLQMSQMFAAKLYDRTRGTVTVKTLLDAAVSQAGIFKHGTALDVRTAAKQAEAQIDTLHQILDSVQDRRNQAIAHLDPSSVTNPTALADAAKLTIKDLEQLFTVTGMILNEFSRLWCDITSVMELIGADDLTSALDLIADAKHAQADKYESQFKEVFPFPRPRKPKSPW